MTLDDLGRIEKTLETMRGTERMRTELEKVMRALDRYPIIVSWGEFWASRSFTDLDVLPVQYEPANVSSAIVTKIVSVLQSADLVRWEQHLRGRELLDETGNGGNGGE